MIISRTVLRDGMGLVPLAVLPAWQRQGIGTLLIKQGIEILKNRGCPYVNRSGASGVLSFAYPRFD